MILKLIAVILATVLSFRLIVRYILPMLGLYVVKKASKNMEEKMKEKSQGQKIYQKGDTEIRLKSNQNGSSNSKTDDYIDFEEVD
tara:strand:- start:1791 stop:2045 length:255 start_codon:yes stop_codon:yes gene_type:complete